MFNLELLKKLLSKKVFGLFIILILGIILKPLYPLIILTFLFSFIFYNMQVGVNKLLNKLFKVTLNEKVCVALIHLIFGTILVFMLIHFVPLAITQISGIIKQIINLDLTNSNLPINQDILTMISNLNIGAYLKSNESKITGVLMNVGITALDVIISYILSFFILYERKTMIKFGNKVENSNISFVYNEFKHFGDCFVNSFGKIMQGQIIISFINACASTIIFLILGFPNIVGLTFMIFLFGIIPVAGVAISFIPLSIVAFNTGGLFDVVLIIAMIVLLHVIEVYILNPKIMASVIKLPKFIILITLILSEHFIGAFGLLVGLPLLIFILDITDIKPFITNVGSSPLEK